MSDRRKFLKKSVLGSAALITAPSLSARVSGNSSAAQKPVVVSTWDFGKAANAAAWEVLSKKGSALDAVEAGVKVAEADPNNQSVGYGGLPDRDGRVTLDACIMDSEYRCGSVMCLEYIKHPVSVARMVMEKTPHIVLVGDGALEFALANGFTKTNLLTEQSKKDWEEWLKTSNYKPGVNIENKLYKSGTDSVPGGKDNHDTIGMITLDATGNMAGACTTSGLAYKMRGRVGDSPVIGAGLYVDNEIGGATATGLGEEVIRIVGSHLVVELMRHGYSPQNACKEAVNRILKRTPQKAKEIQIGFLALNKKGESGAYALQSGFNYAVRTDKQDSIIPAKFLI